MIRTTSALNDADNDTGRTAYCGPYVISAITGYPISRIEEEIRAARGRDGEVKGTTAQDVDAALALYGYGLHETQSYLHLERRARPTVLAWMQRPRSAWTHYVLAIHKGREGHWIVVKGVKCSDTYSRGQWQFVVDGPHRSARIMAVYEVRRVIAGA